MFSEDIHLEELYDEPPITSEEESNPIRLKEPDVVEEPPKQQVEVDDELAKEMDDMQELAAADLKSNVKFPCWFHYKFGKCTKNGCKMDHEREAMTRYQDTPSSGINQVYFRRP
jgi:hypothetical protein